jgi:hypothetical protein
MSMPTTNLNANHPPLTYRIGTSDRVIGGPTAAPDGFSVLNQTNLKVFVASGGVWTDGGSMPSPSTPFDMSALLAAWYGTNTTNLGAGQPNAVIEKELLGRNHRGSRVSDWNLG